MDSGRNGNNGLYGDHRKTISTSQKTIPILNGRPPRPSSNGNGMNFNMAKTMNFDKRHTNKSTDLTDFLGYTQPSTAAGTGLQANPKDLDQFVAPGGFIQDKLNDISPTRIVMNNDLRSGTGLINADINDAEENIVSDFTHKSVGMVQV